MASYNTVPDLESEAQPLVAAPPRKHGKAMLAVVAALAFGAGALAPSAVSRVSQMKMFQYTTGGVTVQSTTSADGGEEVYISTDGPASRNGVGGDSGIHEDGTPTDGTTPDQDPAIVNYIPGAVQSSQSTDCNKAGGETVTTNPDCSDAIIQDAQETGGTGGETARK